MLQAIQHKKMSLAKSQQPATQDKENEDSIAAVEKKDEDEEDEEESHDDDTSHVHDSETEVSFFTTFFLHFKKSK